MPAIAILGAVILSFAYAFYKASKLIRRSLFTRPNKAGSVNNLTNI